MPMGKAKFSNRLAFRKNQSTRMEKKSPGTSSDIELFQIGNHLSFASRDATQFGEIRESIAIDFEDRDELKFLKKELIVFDKPDPLYYIAKSSNTIQS